LRRSAPPAQPVTAVLQTTRLSQLPPHAIGARTLGGHALRAEQRAADCLNKGHATCAGVHRQRGPCCPAASAPYATSHSTSSAAGGGGLATQCSDCGCPYVARSRCMPCGGRALAPIASSSGTCRKRLLTCSALLGSPPWQPPCKNQGHAHGPQLRHLPFDSRVNQHAVLGSLQESIGGAPMASSYGTCHRHASQRCALFGSLQNTEGQLHLSCAMVQAFCRAPWSETNPHWQPPTTTGPRARAARHGPGADARLEVGCAKAAVHAIHKHIEREVQLRCGGDHAGRVRACAPVRPDDAPGPVFAARMRAAGPAPRQARRAAAR